jgi:hypothetical protein
MLKLSHSSFRQRRGFSVLQIIERSKGVSQVIYLGKVSVAWLLTTVEALTQWEGLKEFVKSSRVGNKAFIALRCSNNHGCFLALVEYGGGGWRGFIVIPKGREGKGWSVGN